VKRHETLLEGLLELQSHQDLGDVKELHQKMRVTHGDDVRIHPKLQMTDEFQRVKILEQTGGDVERKQKIWHLVDQLLELDPLKRRRTTGGAPMLVVLVVMMLQPRVLGDDLAPGSRRKKSDQLLKPLDVVRTITPGVEVVLVVLVEVQHLPRSAMRMLGPGARVLDEMPLLESLPVSLPVSLQRRHHDGQHQQLLLQQPRQPKLRLTTTRAGALWPARRKARRQVVMLMKVNGEQLHQLKSPPQEMLATGGPHHLGRGQQRSDASASI
jgi:hypothetical protein